MGYRVARRMRQALAEAGVPLVRRGAVVGVAVEGKVQTYNMAGLPADGWVPVAALAVPDVAVARAYAAASRAGLLPAWVGE
jgi:hypothetical protein